MRIFYLVFAASASVFLASGCADALGFKPYTLAGDAGTGSSGGSSGTSGSSGTDGGTGASDGSASGDSSVARNDSSVVEAGPPDGATDATVLSDGGATSDGDATLTDGTGPDAAGLPTCTLGQSIINECLLGP